MCSEGRSQAQEIDPEEQQDQSDLDLAEPWVAQRKRRRPDAPETRWRFAEAALEFVLGIWPW